MIMIAEIIKFISEIDGVRFLCMCAAISIILMLAVILIAHVLKARREFGKLKIRPRSMADGIVFGRQPWRRRLVCSPTNAEGHILATGGSGSGKTSGLLIPTLRAWRGSALVLDISGDIEKNVVSDKAVIAPNGGGNACYDVLAAVDGGGSDGEKNERLGQLAFALIPDRPAEDVTAFYLEEGRKMLRAALIAYYHAGLDFPEMCKMILRLSGIELLEDIAASGNDLAVALGAGFSGTNEKTIAATKQELNKKIEIFAVNEKIQSAIKRGGVSPATLETKSIYLNIPDEKLEIYSDFMRVVVAQSLHYLSARPNGKKPSVLVSLDEFSSFGKLDIMNALRKLRKKNVRILVLTQSLADIDLIYGEKERRAMLDNFPIKAVFSANDLDTMKYYSDLAGTKIVKKSTVTKQTRDDTGRESRAESDYREKVVQPEEFGRLDNERWMFLFHPSGLLKLKRNYFYKDKSYRRRAGEAEKKKMERESAREWKAFGEKKQKLIKIGALVRTWDTPDGYPEWVTLDEARRRETERHEKEGEEDMRRWREEYPGEAGEA